METYNQMIHEPTNGGDMLALALFILSVGVFIGTIITKEILKLSEEMFRTQEFMYKQYIDLKEQLQMVNDKLNSQKIFLKKES